MTIHTQYINPDDFINYFGIDLGSRLKGNQNPSDKATAFLMRVENDVESFMNAHFFKNISIEYGKMSDYQKEHYRLALLEQAYYIFKNGDIGSDSGYNPESGIVASNHALTEITIGEKAKNHLKLSGLWTGHIGAGGFFGPWVM